MELYPLKVFLAVATEKSFSRAAEKMLRTQPAISLAVQRLEAELGEKLIDRSSTPPILTDAGRIVLEYAQRFENLEAEMQNSLAELRDNSAGRLIIGANESTSLYLLQHIEQYRTLYPKVKSSGPPQPVEQDSDSATRWRSGAWSDQLRSRRRSAGVQSDLHRPSGLCRLPASPFREGKDRVDHRT